MWSTLLGKKGEKQTYYVFFIYLHTMVKHGWLNQLCELGSDSKWHIIHRNTLKVLIANGMFELELNYLVVASLGSCLLTQPRPKSNHTSKTFHLAVSTCYDTWFFFLCFFSKLLLAHRIVYPLKFRKQKSCFRLKVHGWGESLDLSVEKEDTYTLLEMFMYNIISSTLFKKFLKNHNILRWDSFE